MGRSLKYVKWPLNGSNYDTGGILLNRSAPVYGTISNAFTCGVVEMTGNSRKIIQEVGIISAV